MRKYSGVPKKKALCTSFQRVWQFHKYPSLARAQAISLSNFRNDTPCCNLERTKTIVLREPQTSLNVSYISRYTPSFFPARSIACHCSTRSHSSCNTARTALNYIDQGDWPAFLLSRILSQFETWSHLALALSLGRARFTAMRRGASTDKNERNVAGDRCNRCIHTRTRAHGVGLARRRPILKSYRRFAAGVMNARPKSTAMPFR